MELKILSLLCVSCRKLLLGVLQAIVEAECLLGLLLLSVLVCNSLWLGIVLIQMVVVVILLRLLY